MIVKHACSVKVWADTRSDGGHFWANCLRPEGPCRWLTLAVAVASYGFTQVRDAHQDQIVAPDRRHAVAAGCHLDLGAVQLVSQDIAPPLVALREPEHGDVHEIDPVLDGNVVEGGHEEVRLWLSFAGAGRMDERGAVRSMVSPSRSSVCLSEPA